MNKSRTKILDKKKVNFRRFSDGGEEQLFWLKDSDEAGFIANGDIIEILEIFNIKELYGFKFAKVKIRMIDYPNQIPFETVLLLDTIKVNHHH
jgi:hypothetical protein